MKNILHFVINVGKLKNIYRKGITFYGVKNPETTNDHVFRTAIIALVLTPRKKLNLEKVLKIALIHDLCKVYAGDITPYDGFLPKDKKERYQFVRKWPRLLKREKEKWAAKKFEKEYSSLKKLISKLPKRLKKEILTLWTDYTKWKTPEGKFVYQLDMAENLVEALEHRKKNKKFPTQPWWEHADEVIDDPILLKFLKEIEKEELKKNQ